MDFDATRSFHLWKDAAATQLLDPQIIGRFTPGPTSHKETKHIVVRERNLSYSFRPHYHAWVTEVTRRLLSGSTKALQAVDTEHRTRVSATSDTAARRGGDGGPAVTVKAGEIVTLPDDVSVRLDGGAAHVAGRHFVDADGSAVAVRRDDAIRVPAGVAVTRPDRTQVVLTAELIATLVDGAPRPTLHREHFTAYKPNPALVPNTELSPHPVDELDFSVGGAYSVYNWELFFHVPFTVAVNLSRNGRYAEAMKWFHYLFDPTDDSSEVTPERYWKVKPFLTTDVQRIEEILVNLSTGTDPVLHKDTVNVINAWKDAPFRPHVVARYRHSAYMFKTVMAYLDNLVAWGDSLFRQDTGEAIDEAMQLYVLAANILGPRPQAVPAKGSIRAQTYATLRSELDEFANTMRDVEGSLLLDLAPRPSQTTTSTGLVSLRNLGRSLYFGVPRNDKLLGYWDTVADRLYKIRNSLNIEGVFRQLPLFEPPIDPAMLARAAAAGLDTAAIVAGTAQRLPLVRFALLHRQATELAQQVASLGASLLAALEKDDGAALTLMRARHDRLLATLTEEVRYGQYQVAVKSREALLGSLNTAVTQYAFYEQQLGKSLSEIRVPQLDPIDAQALARYNLQTAEPTLSAREIELELLQKEIDAARGRQLNRFEAGELDLITAARTIQDVIKIAQLAGQAASMIPDFGVKFHFWGLGGDFGFGGTQLAKFASFAAEVAAAAAGSTDVQASIAAKVGAIARREQEWAQQSNVVASEISQIFKQLRAAELREAVAERELRNHRVQIQNAEEIEHFLNAENASPKGRTTNKAMYAWMKREIRGLHSRNLAIATELAAKAQLALQHELGNRELTFIGQNYQAGHEGLLAGERLLFDLKRMELAFHENNIREYELVKHVSLAQVNPFALITLRATGRCEFELPETLFDLDSPGHYFRRIRSVAISVPCVTGPHTSVNCTLRLQKSSVRRTATLDAELEETHGAIESVVASTAVEDSGIFDDVHGTDERRLPFELSGAVSTWIVELPGRGTGGYRVFDYDTISDVILHMRFTAREGGETLRAAAIERVDDLVKGEGTSGRIRLFSLRHEFPAAWAQLVAAAAAPAPVTLTLTADMFPFWSAGKLKSVESAAVYRPPATPGDDPQLVAEITGPDAPKLGIPWTLQLDPASKDVWILVTWKG